MHEHTFFFLVKLLKRMGRKQFEACHVYGLGVWGKCHLAFFGGRSIYA